MKGLTMYQRQAPYFPRRADSHQPDAAAHHIPCHRCLFILCGTPVQAQVSYSLDGTPKSGLSVARYARMTALSIFSMQASFMKMMR